jgi:hypothetical protein
VCGSTYRRLGVASRGKRRGRYVRVELVRRWWSEQWVSSRRLMAHYRTNVASPLPRLSIQPRCFPEFVRLTTRDVSLDQGIEEGADELAS